MEEREAPSTFSVASGSSAGFPASDPISRDLRTIVSLSSDFQRRLARLLGVGPTDLSAMEHLIESGPLSPSELARRLSITTAAATLMVDRLENVGHASRSPHPEDRRRVVVAPAAPSVERATIELLPLIRGVAEVTGDLSDDDAAVIERFLESVIGVYREVLADD